MSPWPTYVTATPFFFFFIPWDYFHCNISESHYRARSITSAVSLAEVPLAKSSWHKSHSPRRIHSWLDAVFMEGFAQCAMTLLPQPSAASTPLMEPLGASVPQLKVFEQHLGCDSASLSLEPKWRTQVPGQAHIWAPLRLVISWEQYLWGEVWGSCRTWILGDMMKILGR